MASATSRLAPIIVLIGLFLVSNSDQAATTREALGVSPAGRVMPQMFGARCDGVTDDAAAFAAALAASKTVIVPASSAPCAISGVAVAADHRIDGLGAGKVKVIAGGAHVRAFIVTGNGAAIDGLDCDLNGQTGDCFDVAGPLANVQITNNRFHGSGTGFYFAAVGDPGDTGATKVQSLVFSGNVADQRDGSVLAGGNAFEFQSVADLKYSNNTCFDDNDFCAELKWSSGTIAGHRVQRPDYGSAVTASGTSVPFTVARKVGRCGLQDNGVPVVIGSGGYTLAGCDGTTTRLVATIPAGSIGHDITLVAFRAPEGLEIQSGSGPVTINSAYIDGAGDGGIVVGSDYHYDGSRWVYTPSSRYYADQPFNVTIHNATIRNVLNAGLDWDSGCPNGFSVDGFNISNFNLGASGVDNHAAAIWVPYATVHANCRLRVGQGVIDNSNGTGQYGVALAGWGQTEQPEPEPQVALSAITIRDRPSGARRGRPLVSHIFPSTFRP